MPLSLTITGTNESGKVGDTLKAIVTGADVVTYSWTADGTEVGTEEDLDITSDMLGKKIQVKVTALDGETVKSEESAPVEYETPELVTAVRKAANSFTATFDSEADEIVKADDIEVISEDGTDVKKITGLDFSLDGLSAVVTVNTSFKDGVTYNVNYGDSTASFVASVGEVDKIVITTSEAEVNTPTTIEFALFDANGVDVTSAVKVDETCTVTFEGDYDNYNNKKASASTVTMATAGSTCTVTVEYDKNDGVSDQVTASKDITCVAASEKMGVPFFKQDPLDNINERSECYRFYDPKSSTDTNVTVEIDDNELVHFYAQDADKSAIDYDSYEIESADETIATAQIDKGEGKWASFTVTGNSTGNVLLELKATKNGAETTYDIPVTVTEKQAPVKAKMTFKGAGATMSNAWDTEYKGTIVVSVTDAAGNTAHEELYSEPEISLKTTNKGVDKDLAKDPLYDGNDATGFQVKGTTYTAYAAEAGAYVIEAEVTDLTSGKVLTARNTVTVKELPAEAWFTTGSTATDWYAPLPFEDENPEDPTGIDANSGLPESVVSKLPWITDETLATLADNSEDAGKLSNADELALAGDVNLIAEPADGTAWVDATHAGKYVYYSDGTALPDTDALLGEVKDQLNGESVTITRKALEKDSNDKVALGTAETKQARALLDPDGEEPEFYPTPAGKDAYPATKTYTSYTNNAGKAIGAKASYTIELSDSDKTIGFTADTCTMTARLSATMNGLFAGYVQPTGLIGYHNADKAGVYATTTTGIVNNADMGMPLQIQTYFGTNMLNDDADGITELFRPTLAYAEEPDEAIADDEATLGAYYITKNALKEEALDFFTKQTDQVKNDYDFAREGSYKVEFTYWKANSNKKTTESAAFTVKNDLYVPGVTVKSQYLDSYDQEGWKDAVVSEVDLNQDDSSMYSVIGLVFYDKDDETIKGIGDDKTPAKWAVVIENGTNFYKPLDRTFKLS